MWRVSARQGRFADYGIGTVTLPGRLAVTPPPTPMTWGEKQPWDAIRPPVAPDGSGAVQADTAAAGPVTAAPEAAAPLGVVLAVAGLVVAGGAALLLGGRHLRARLRR